MAVFRTYESLQYQLAGVADSKVKTKTLPWSLDGWLAEATLITQL
jgi:hypothetical protein